MDSLLTGYGLFLEGSRIVLFIAAIILAVIALFDWLVRTRRISPFNGLARFFRRSVDPMMTPVERIVLRAGGLPSAAPWWALVALVLGGVGVLVLLDFIGGLLQQLAFGLRDPHVLPIMLLGWAFKLVELALMIRVLSTWLPISPYSRWIRWTYPLTNWILIPLRRVIPLMGRIDVSPIVAYLLLAWILEPVVLRLVRSALGE
ncbi:MAG: YggT family protein [Gemmatimonadaceae bacterium]